MGINALLELFGRALMARLGQNRDRISKRPRVARPCKRKGHSGGAGGRQNPAGTKLVRSFIRRSGTESTYNRSLYAYMTGKQYKGVSS